MLMSFARVGACLCLMASAAFAADDYPSRPVHLVVASAAGGGTDTVGRILAAHLTKALGQQVVVDNRPGASNVVGSDAVARAAPDGYTLLMTASTIAINHVMYKKLPYDARRDFAPITQMVTLPNVLVVNAHSPYRSTRDFIDAAKAKPGSLTFGSAGVGSAPHFAMELFKSTAGIDVTHVPYTSVTQALNDIVGGRVDSMMVNYLSARPLMDSGVLRALAVSSLKRSVYAPDLPTVDESGVPGYEAIQWFGLLAPKGTPDAIVDRLYSETANGLRQPEMRAILAAQGAEPSGDTPAEFKALISTEMDKWTKVAAEAHIQPE